MGECGASLSWADIRDLAVSLGRRRSGEGIRLLMARAGACLVTIVFSLLISGNALAMDGVAVPGPSARVTDLTATLSAAQLRSLDQSLGDFERSKGSQIAVLMLPSVGPETIEQYSMRVADAWRIGRARVDDCVILIIAKNDQRLRIEVGRGLEGAIPDVVAKRVIREVIAPHFLAGDFYSGIADGTRTLMKLIEGEQLPPARQQAKAPQSRDDYESLFVMVLVLALVLGRILAAVFGRVGGATLVSAVAGGAAWLITGALAAAILAAIAGFIFTLVAGASAGRFLGGGFGGGGLGGGWAGGGGFFGGGGASGSWGN